MIAVCPLLFFCSQRDRFRARVQEVEGHLAALAQELKKARLDRVLAMFSLFLE